MIVFSITLTIVTSLALNLEIISDASYSCHTKGMFGWKIVLYIFLFSVKYVLKKNIVFLSENKWYIEENKESLFEASSCNV